jgi:hypothetical protein
MTQTLYAHMNKRKKKEKQFINQTSKQKEQMIKKRQSIVKVKWSNT